MAPLFVTIAAARDMPARLAGHLKNFDPRIVGLTGSNEQIAAAAKAHRVYYSPTEHERAGTDVVNHSTFLYFMESAGKFDALLSSNIDANEPVASMRTKPDAKP